MTVIAALDDPLSILLADDLADVMAPDHDGANPGSTRVRAIVSPGAGQIIGRAGIAPDLTTHVPTAPRSRPAGIMAAAGVVMTTAAMVTVMMTTGMMVVMVVVMSRPGFCVRSNQTERCRHSQNSTRHRYSFVWGRSRQCDPRRRQIEGQFMPGRRGSTARTFVPLGRF